ncbi:MAG: hypothetical protein IJ129_07225 [Ruminococcus sp.]|nr:hypothetical protein [Ruminococcus sp.]
MNTELLGKLGDIGLSCLIIMVLILGAVLITPKLAGWIQKKNPELAQKIEGKKDTDQKDEDYEVHSAFESSQVEGFDPNYKIYHEDIYGWKFKKKKEK